MYKYIETNNKIIPPAIVLKNAIYDGEF